VIALGVPDPTYQWYVNGNPFNGAASSTLSFTNTRSTDAGNYTVVVTNALGSVTSAKATLRSPPRRPLPVVAAVHVGVVVLILGGLGLLRQCARRGRSGLGGLQSRSPSFRADISLR